MWTNKQKSALLCWSDEKWTAHTEYRDIMVFCYRTGISSHFNDAISSSLLAISLFPPRVTVHCTITRARVQSASSIPVVAPSKASICGRALARIAGSIPAVGSDVCLDECSVLSGRGLCDGQIPHKEEPYLERQRERACVCVCHWVCSGATITLYAYSE